MFRVYLIDLFWVFLYWFLSSAPVSAFKQYCWSALRLPFHYKFALDLTASSVSFCQFGMVKRQTFWPEPPGSRWDLVDIFRNLVPRFSEIPVRSFSGSQIEIFRYICPKFSEIPVRSFSRSHDHALARTIWKFFELFQARDLSISQDRDLDWTSAPDTNFGSVRKGYKH